MVVNFHGKNWKVPSFVGWMMTGATPVTMEMSKVNTSSMSKIRIIPRIANHLRPPDDGLRLGLGRGALPWAMENLYPSRLDLTLGDGKSRFVLGKSGKWSGHEPFVHSKLLNYQRVDLEKPLCNHVGDFPSPPETIDMSSELPQLPTASRFRQQHGGEDRKFINLGMDTRAGTSSRNSVRKSRDIKYYRTHMLYKSYPPATQPWQCQIPNEVPCFFRWNAHFVRGFPFGHVHPLVDVGPPKLQHAVALLVTAAPQSSQQIKCYAWYLKMGEMTHQNCNLITTGCRATQFSGQTRRIVWWEDLWSDMLGFLLPFTWLCVGLFGAFWGKPT